MSDKVNSQLTSEKEIPLDINVVIETFGDEEAAIMFIGSFKEQTFDNDTLDNINAVIKASNFPEIRRLSHSLKGSAR